MSLCINRKHMEVPNAVSEAFGEQGDQVRPWEPPGKFADFLAFPLLT